MKHLYKVPIEVIIQSERELDNYEVYFDVSPEDGDDGVDWWISRLETGDIELIGYTEKVVDRYTMGGDTIIKRAREEMKKGGE